MTPSSLPSTLPQPLKGLPRSLLIQILFFSKSTSRLTSPKPFLALIFIFFLLAFQYHAYHFLTRMLALLSRTKFLEFKY